MTMRLSGSAAVGTLSNVASLTATGLNLGSGANLVSSATETGRMLDGRNTSLLPDGIWNGSLTDRVCADPDFASNPLIQSCNDASRKGSHIKFHANQAGVTKAPFELLRGRNGSCTSTAIFLVAALRSVGVPARVAGVPQWVHAKAIAKLARGEGLQNHD